MVHKLSRLFDLVLSIAKLPTAQLEFCRAINPNDVSIMHRQCTRRHPKYLVFQNKSLGTALLDLTKFRHPEEYMATIKGRNCAAQHAKKAKAKGYRVVEIDRNNFIDDIHEINTSVEIRQGRPMDVVYQQKITHYPTDQNFKYYGVLNAAGKLMAYGDLGFYGNFFAFNRIIGIRNNDGVMHLMVTDIICKLIEGASCRYLMYDTYFGASPGMKAFKNMLGFEPYRAKYSIQ